MHRFEALRKALRKKLHDEKRLNGEVIELEEQLKVNFILSFRTSILFICSKHMASKLASMQRLPVLCKMKEWDTCTILGLHLQSSLSSIINF